jgi:hypothetical protein
MYARVKDTLKNGWYRVSNSLVLIREHELVGSVVTMNDGSVNPSLATFRNATDLHQQQLRTPFAAAIFVQQESKLEISGDVEVSEHWIAKLNASEGSYIGDEKEFAMANRITISCNR